MNIEIPSDEECSTPVATTMLTEKSRGKYETLYQKFEIWCAEQHYSNINDKVVLEYFKEKSAVQKSSTLFTNYSILKSMLCLKKNIDISKFNNVTTFLKMKSRGYKAKKSRTLSMQDFEKFLKEADDEKYLLVKVAMIFGIIGVCRREELTYLPKKNVKDEGSFIRINIQDSTTKILREFIVTAGNIEGISLMEIVRKYDNLRPKTDLPRYFIGYRNGKCTKQPVGINTFGSMPKYIAAFLKLPGADQYTGHCFRRSAATWRSGSDFGVLRPKRFRMFSNLSFRKDEDDDNTNDTTNARSNSLLPLIHLNEAIKANKVDEANECTQMCLICSNLKELTNMQDKDPQGITWKMKLKFCVPDLDWNWGSFICKNCVSNVVSTCTFRNACLGASMQAQGIYKLTSNLLHCRICLEYFESYPTLASHYVASHNIDFPYICDLCNHRFKSENEFQHHLLRHYTLQKYRCDKCDTMYAVEEDFMLHDILKHSEPKQICNICNLTFPTDECLNDHEVIIHSLPKKSRALTNKNELIGDVCIPDLKVELKEEEECQSEISDEDDLNSCDTDEMQNMDLDADDSNIREEHSNSEQEESCHKKNLNSNEFHLRLNNEDCNFYCQPCKKTFISQKLFITHNSQIHGDLNHIRDMDLSEDSNDDSFLKNINNITENINAQDFTKYLSPFNN